jgi:hypothetical protein
MQMQPNFNPGFKAPDPLCLCSLVGVSVLGMAPPAQRGSDPQQKRRDKAREGRRGGSSAVPIGKGSHGRIRTTNRALESRQFATVRMPRRSEVSGSRTLAPELRAGEAGRKAVAMSQRSKLEKKMATAAKGGVAATDGDATKKRVGPSTTPTFENVTAAAAESLKFDPIPNDPTFLEIHDSKLWPPPPLDAATLALAGAGGLDQYDRRDDEAAARKQRVKAMAGEVSHPRGRVPKNAKQTFEDSDDPDE